MEPDGCGWSFQEDIARRSQANASESADVQSSEVPPPPTSSGAKFSDDGGEVIARGVAQTATPRPPLDLASLEAQYELQRCVDCVQKKGYKRVSLQFPDEMLPDSAAVVRILRTKTSATFYVLGDTSYGSCCVDEVAASHVASQLVIHFGPSCLSQPSQLPVLHVFGQVHVDVDHCSEWMKRVASAQFVADGIPEADTPAPIVLFDVQVAHAATSLRARDDLPALQWTELCLPSLDGSDGLLDLSEEEKEVRFGRFLPAANNNSLFLWIGERNRTLTNFMMHYRESEFYVYDPAEQQVAAGPARVAQERSQGGKLLSRRYFLMQKARDANTVGIVAGTLGVKGCVDTMRQIKEICRRAGKKTYTFVMGKLNVPKLANFTEIDVFVLVACPENSLLDAREFYRPVITPFEMQCACASESEWVNRYELDFRHVGNRIKSNLSSMPDDPSQGEPRFSFIKGGIIDEVTMPQNVGVDLPLAVLRTTGAVAELPAARFLAKRSFSGLEQRIGETPVVDAVEGRSGVAASYSEEPSA